LGEKCAVWFVMGKDGSYMLVFEMLVFQIMGFVVEPYKLGKSKKEKWIRNIYIYIYICIYMYVCTYVCMYICMYVCMREMTLWKYLGKSK